MIDHVSLGGCAVDLRTEADLISTVQATMEDSSKPVLAVGSANLDHVYHFGVGGPHEDVFRSAAVVNETAEGDQERLRGGGETIHWLLLLDGMPLRWRTEALCAGRWPRMAGSDLILPILRLCADHGYRVGFFGGTPNMHTALRETLEAHVPALKVVGYWAPDRSDLSDPVRARRLTGDVRLSGAEVLFVGLGKPRQEAWIQQHGLASGARCLLAFGASADFVAGLVPRAPQLIRDSGLEWLYRLAHEPRRLGRRYLREGPVALARLLVASSPPRDAR